MFFCLEGKVLASSKETVFTSENISETFNAPLELNKTECGYRLEFLGSPRDFGI